MAFKALDELLDDSLALPIGGRTYTVPAPSAEIGLRVQALINAAAVAADGGEADEEVLADAAELPSAAEPSAPRTRGDGPIDLLANATCAPCSPHPRR